MLNKTALILVALLVLQVSTQTHEFVFAFSWLGGFCRGKKGENTCLKEKYKLWDQQSFTIHGLWSQERYSPRIFGDFDVGLIKSDETLADNLMNYMPPMTKPHQQSLFLWDHQWEANSDAHGHDYGNVVVEVFPEKYKGLSEEERNVKVQQDFFHEIVKFYESYPGAQKISKRYHTRAELAGLFGVNPNGLHIECYSGTYVKELRVCATLSQSGFAVAECETTGNCHQNTLDLWGWKKTSQTRVIAVDNQLKSELGLARIQVNAKSSSPPKSSNSEAQTEDSSSQSSSEDL